MRKDFWKSDWSLGVVVALAVAAVASSDLIKSLERRAYDLGVRASNRVPSDRIAVIAIARITDFSKTKTGMVLGTPSYMSPEQLAGKKIDGQSDLLSLGVTLYQLCCFE